MTLAFLDSFGGAIEFIFNQREPVGVGGKPVGGLDEVARVHVDADLDQRCWRSRVALAIAFPLGVYLGHRGTGEVLAVALGNAGRAVPELALIAFMAAFVGFGVLNADDRADGPRHPADPHQRLRRHAPGRPRTRSRRRGGWG